jgi:indolepyruvate ferredoxin oxidoreductase
VSRFGGAALDNKYVVDRGEVFMTGVQALVRLPIEQARRDRSAGLNTGILISGYPGSPLGGYDIELSRASTYLRPLDIHFIAGLNEELAAANVWGTQMCAVLGDARVDGAIGIWYGKAPGVDRSLDVLRHANLGGGSKYGALLALAADDAGAKSSTIPNQSELDFIACAMPVLTPATVEEFLTFGLHAIALSRFTGLWAGMKCPTDICDGAATFGLPGADLTIRVPELDGYRKPSTFLWGTARGIELERHLFDERLPAAIEYIRANKLNWVQHTRQGDRIGIIASGKTYVDVVQALEDLGLGDTELHAAGIRIAKIGMIYPLDHEFLRAFSKGLEEIIVIEEKRNIIESELLAALFRSTLRPRVVGKHDEVGRVLFPSHGELDADLIAGRLAARILRLEPLPERVRKRAAELESMRSRTHSLLPLRAPNYCSGCPHNRSTFSKDARPVGGGIGCHAIAALTTQPERQVTYLAPMGAEGSPWIGASRFVTSQSFVQNIGDGTFFHSGSQSLRAAVSAGVNITFRLLYNGHIAMTGGQQPAGFLDLNRLAQYLHAEGVSRTIIITDRLADIRRSSMPKTVSVLGREQYEDALKVLQNTLGTTVLVFDQECAAEVRRARRRGLAPEPSKYIVINEAVCEGCGDCGAKSNCMSVEPVETEFGRKTRINQDSCNKDYSCVSGDCPAFVTVYSKGGIRREPAPRISSASIPLPPAISPADETYRILMTGIGGTGVLTVNQVLAYAAHLEGMDVASLGQTGLAQKGGAVTTHLTLFLGSRPKYFANRISAGMADLVLAFDTVTLTAPYIADRMSPGHTTVVGDEEIRPTAESIRDVEYAFPTDSAMRGEVSRFSSASANVWIPASRVSRALFADAVLTNVVVLGYAVQAGLVPLSPESIEEAFRANGVSVQDNLLAFTCGRLLRHDPAQILDALAGDRERAGHESSAGPERRRSRGHEALMDRCEAFGDEAKGLARIRVDQLVEYQDVRYADRYLSSVERVHARDVQGVGVKGEELTKAAIRWLYKVMAYKDEYEVARLLVRSREGRRIGQMFATGSRFAFNLHPPMLREHGLTRKVELGRWFVPVLWLLIPLRRLRGSRWDVFGRTEVRRAERDLVTWYEDLLDCVVEHLSPGSYELGVRLASSPDWIRGYEQIKMASMSTVKAQVALQLAEYMEATKVSG